MQTTCQKCASLLPALGGEASAAGAFAAATTTATNRFAPRRSCRGSPIALVHPVLHCAGRTRPRRTLGLPPRPGPPRSSRVRSSCPPHCAIVYLVVLVVLVSVAVSVCTKCTDHAAIGAMAHMQCAEAAPGRARNLRRSARSVCMILGARAPRTHRVDNSCSPAAHCL